MAKDGEQRSKARTAAAARRRAAEAEAAAAARRRRLIQLGVAAVFALVIVVAVVIATGGDGDEGESSAEVEARYEGIPQDGIALGDPNAPATMIEFADLQCPFCAQYATGVLPKLIDRYVRPGELRLEINLIAFLGADSEEAARFAAATALQDRLWQFVDLFYHDQGPENSGYVTEDFLREIAESTPGLDVEQAFSDSESAEAEALVSAADDEARRMGVEQTPSFFLASGSGEPEPLDVRLEAAAFEQPIESAIAD